MHAAHAEWTWTVDYGTTRTSLPRTWSSGHGLGGSNAQLPSLPRLETPVQMNGHMQMPVTSGMQLTCVWLRPATLWTLEFRVGPL